MFALPPVAIAGILVNHMFFNKNKVPEPTNPPPTHSNSKDVN